MASWETWGVDGRRAVLAKTPIVVLMGGRSAERDVSLTSGRAALAALKDLSGPSYDVAPSVFELEIDTQGRWCLDGAALLPQRAVEALPEDAVYWLALHGGEGEDGRVQGFLELAGRRHTGAGTATSSLCMDKHHSRLVAADAGVAVAPGLHIQCGQFERDRSAAEASIRALGPGTHFVKHSSAGSSFGVHRCQTPDEMVAAAQSIAKSGGNILVEGEVRGLEITVGVIGDGAAAAALPIVEIEPVGEAFFDHAQKYSASGGALEACPPVQLSTSIQERIQERAKAAWEAFGGTGYARIDFMVPSSGGKPGARRFDPEVEPVLLEANTLPGFTPRSLLPLAAKSEGVGFRELCLELVSRAIG